MATKTFRVARAGQTTDGREITRDHINQMAANYDPQVYGARVNLEHLRGLFPDSTFRSYGDVVSLSTEEEDGQLYLLAELDPTPDLISLAKARQKVYFSIELDRDFADTNEAYLVGLACTDSPASLGTSYMQFCQQNPNSNPFADRKQKPENVFSTAEFEWEYKEEPQSVLSAVKAKFAAKKTKADSDQYSAADALTHLPETLDEFKQAFSTIASAVDNTNALVGNISNNFNSFLEKQTEIESSLSDVQGHLDNTPDDNYTPRPAATGSSDYIKSDC